MEYHIRKVTPETAAFAAGKPGAFGVPAGLECAPISQYVWDAYPYRPKNEAYVGWNEKGLEVWLLSDETELRMEGTHTGDMVCRDSCLEFFLQPDPEKDLRYINYECSPYPCVYMGIGSGRHDSRKILTLPRGMEPESVILPGTGWGVHYRITAEYLRDEFGVALRSGTEMMGNFYKCGDLTPQPHYGSWSPVDNLKYPEPDFHRPEYFERLIIG